MAIDLITKHIQKQLQDLPLKHRWDLAKMSCDGPLPSNVIVLKETNQVKVRNLNHLTNLRLHYSILHIDSPTLGHAYHYS